MPHHPSNIEILFRKYSAAEASEEEVREMFRLIAKGQYDPELVKLLQADIEMSDNEGTVTAERKVKVLRRIKEVIGILEGDPAVPAKKRSYRWLAIAAAVVVVLSVGIWFSAVLRPDAGQDLAQAAQQIAAGKNTATLTLPNGETISLSDVKTGVVVNANEMKYNDGTAVDKQGSLPKGERSSMMLTASTPRGGTYQFILPDGTRVWLNAASKISFPSQFSGTNRKILLSGEAYFEVAKNKQIPFIVESNGQKVEVLGTHFNINAYNNENGTETTLLEGSVKVSSLRGIHRNDEKGNGEALLTPGQQATLTATNEITVKPVDVNAAIAWKNGFFEFKRVPLGTIMQDLSRWYDIEVEYVDNAAKEVKLTGYVARSRNISVILERMQATGGVHFKIAGKKVSVYKEK